MNPTSIDLRSIACKGIRSFNLFQSPSTYAVISLADPSDPNNTHRQWYKTAVDSNGGDSPEWDEPFRFYIDGDGRDLAIEFDVMVQGNLPILLGERTVGKATVPVADLLTEGGDGSVRHVSYQIVGTDGRPNGVISFAYNINFPAVSLPHNSPLVPLPVGGGGDYYYPGPPCQQYPSPPSYYPPPVHVAYRPPLDLACCDARPLVPPCCYPPPPPPSQAACCYPAQGGYGYPTEGWDRRMH